MKRFFVALALAGLTTASMAQEILPASKYTVATNGFWANWFASVGGQYGATFSSQEKDVPFAPYTQRRGEFGFNVALGKWFTPGIGLRTKFEGLWADRLIDLGRHDTYNYWNLHEDVMFNLSNLFCGYNEQRVWNFVPYVGLGVARNMTDNIYALSVNGGLLNNIRVSKRVSVFFDVYAMATEGNFDGAAKRGYTDNYAAHKLGHARRWDKQLGVSAGFTFNLGKTGWERVPDVDALMAMNREQIDALNGSVQDLEAENERLRELLANQPVQTETQTVTKTTTTTVITTPCSVFFNIGSSKIASRKDLVNVRELAEYAKANGKKLLVTGYADSGTGSTSINQKLSQARANALVEELVKMGVDRDNITTKACGGVNTLSPASYNRRATVEIQ